MLTAIVAVLGTLAGSLLTGTLQHLSQRAQRRAADAAARRVEGLAAVTELATALSNHRRAMWVREGQRLRGEDWSEARAASHATRSAVTAPLLRVSVLLPDLAAVAQAAARATYELRGASGETSLAAAREHAIQKTDAFIEAAGIALA
ncbi:protein kilB [Streptomyces sp. TRM76323]|uniref:Protein kilB n=1 Tax=Streptomyces tamarix TaxID=3078565 RepID=A0ABU3QUL2_9ACTN|nr:protein kilB [Streptomyces tamarix]MDT9686394.1 protein kilB [Streptomyces tamarix]